MPAPRHLFWALALLAGPCADAVLMSPDLRVRPATAVPPSRLAPPGSPVVPPPLTGTERRRLERAGEVQRKSRRGRAGECLQVVETPLSPEACWDKIADVGAWAGLLRGVRASSVDAVLPDGTIRASFLFTKLRLPATLLLRADRCTVFPDRCVLRFELDPASPSCAVKRCTGKWVVERAPTGAARVSLMADIQATRLVPGMVVDLVAEKALDRAVAWIPRRPDAAPAV